MNKKAAKVPMPEGKTFTKSLPKDVMLPQDRISKQEIDAAVKNPRYRFEERVQDLVNKKATRAEAEQMIRNVIATKELPDDRAHIHTTAKGEAYFTCGDVAFLVDTRDLNKVIGTNGEQGPMNCLMDSQIAAMARSQGWSIEPFVRELLIDGGMFGGQPFAGPLTGLVQLVWWRDIEQHESENLRSKQEQRVALYHKKLTDWKPSDAGDEKKPRTASSDSHSSMMSKSFEVVKGEHANVASGRETDLLKAMRGVKSPMTFSQIVKAAEGKLKTKQDFERIVTRFLKELIGHGAVKQV